MSREGKPGAARANVILIAAVMLLPAIAAHPALDAVPGVGAVPVNEHEPCSPAAGCVSEEDTPQWVDEWGDSMFGDLLMESNLVIRAVPDHSHTLLVEDGNVLEMANGTKLIVRELSDLVIEGQTTIADDNIEAGEVLTFTVNNSTALRIEDTTATANIIGGNASNSVWHVNEEVVGAAIGGGALNEVSAPYAFIGGGYGNEAGSTNWFDPPPGTYATVGGGHENAALGFAAVVSGGDASAAFGNHTAIGGGRWNTIEQDAPLSVIGGGDSNYIYGRVGTIPGGSENQVGGEFGFAAGRKAAAGHAGSFVWADSTDVYFSSTAADEFAARATGGVRFVSAIDASGNPTAGVQLAAGSGSWSTLSDRDLKEAVEPVEPREVLARVAETPVYEWSYTAQGSGVRHMGPMAQDFHASFGLGEDERRISSVDADGVALAAIQGLVLELDERDAKIAELEERLERLEAERAPDAGAVAADDARDDGKPARGPAGWLASLARSVGALFAGIA